MNFDPYRWAQTVWLHPTRLQLEQGYVRAKERLDLKRKLQKRVESSGFAPKGSYYATVVILGLTRHEEYSAMMTATRVLADSPIGFDTAQSWTFHVKYGGRPLIGLVASEEPLDRDSALAHFVTCGDEGQ